MARVRAVDGRSPHAVEGSWQLLLTSPGAWADPGKLDRHADWIPACVPGTAAAALRAAGRWSEVTPTPIHAFDVWYCTHVPGTGRERLHFGGLATLAEVWLDGKSILTSRSMFLAHAVQVDLTPTSELAICFRSLATELARPNKRGRWRPMLATPGSLRHVRTSLLGFMPGWCPSIDSVGLYRPVTREPVEPHGTAALRATLKGEVGRLDACVRLDGAKSGASICCDGRKVELLELAPGRFEGRLELPGIAPWWPHTHGEPQLHAVEAIVGGCHFDLGRVGFRTVALTRPFEEGLSLAINDVPVFCRGACWTPADLVGLSGDAEAIRPLLKLVKDAGMNMLRVPGIGLYEADAFHDLCDEMGILVWQDLMLANFDYPHNEPAFADDLTREVEQFLDRRQTSPSLCVLCGGSEVWQQAAMLGLPSEAWSGGFAAEMLPSLAAELRPDLIIVPNSPSGGDLPFSVSAGVAHYYGVGAYCRSLDDARRAAVGFASECLAFANVPEPASLRQFGLDDPGSKRWAATIPRDRGTDWDFEDVRDHYVAALFGVDPTAMRRQEPERYLALGRAAVAEVMEATFAEWRRPGSPTAGGLVWFLRDLAPGGGWGLIDSCGCPKSAWHALRRAFSPINISLSDEGLSGLHVHVRNETAEPLGGHLRLTFTDLDGRVVAQAERAIWIEPRKVRTWSSADLLGRFFDATYAYRFGPAAHNLSHARLSNPAGELIAESFHFPIGRDVKPRVTGLRASLVQNRENWILQIRTKRHALCVHVETDGQHIPSDNWFHLAPNCERNLSFTGGVIPRGTVRSINGSEIARFGYDDA